MKKIVIIMMALLILAACKTATPTAEVTSDVPTTDTGTQVVPFGLKGGGKYTDVVVEAGKPVTLKNDGSLVGCSMFVVSPELGIQADFSKSDSYTFTPSKKGTFPIACSMNMFQGTITVK